MNIQEIIQYAENLSKQDIAKSIDFILTHKSHEKYYPWGAYTLSKFYKDNNQIEHHEIVLFEILKNANKFEPAISNLIALYKSFAFDRDEKFYTLKKLLENVIEITKQEDRKPQAWFFNDQLLALFILLPNDGIVLIDKICENSTERIKHIIIELFKLLQSTQENRIAVSSSDSFKTWTLSFNRNKSAISNENIFYVDISDLDIQTNLSDIPTPVVDAFVAGLGSIFYNLQYEDDFGYRFWENIKSIKYIYTLKFWQFIRSRILILTSKDMIKLKEVYPKKIIFDSKLDTSNLFVRAGCVEIWVLWNYLNDKNDFLNIVEYVCTNIFQSRLNNISIDIKDVYWPKTNPVNNIIKLITNAGWYSNPESAKKSMVDWCDRYLSALRSGNIIFTVPEHLTTLIPFFDDLSSEKLCNWNLNHFLRSIKNKSIVFVTPYADQIENSWKNGSLANFWHDIGFDLTIQNLKLIKPPISIYPYYPDNSWSESFNKLSSEVDTEIVSSRSDYFIASCGAYGLPITEYVHKNFGITSVYNGHIMNMFFGIYTDSFKDFKLNHPSDYWIDGNLHIDFPEIKKIDAGRYAG